MQSLKNRSVAAFGAVIATVVTFVAAAGPVRAETVQARVSYADLDLATAQGQSVLHSRISRAADTVCGPTDAMNRFRTASCRANAIASAKPVVQVAYNAGTITHAGR